MEIFFTSYPAGVHLGATTPKNYNFQITLYALYHIIYILIFRREKGVETERKVKPESYDKEILDKKKKLEKLQEIENKIKEIEETQLNTSYVIHFSVIKFLSIYS